MPPAKKAAVRPVTFKWAKGNTTLYTIKDEKATYNAGGTEMYRPVVGNLELKPNTGKYFYEIHINCENARIGLCTADADLSREMGTGKGVYSLNLQTGACEYEGEVKKKLWRMVVPVSGAVFGCLFDTDNGTMQIYMNGEFHGTAFNDWFDLQGKNVYPCASVAGIEAHNRNIGIGQKSMVVMPPPMLYPTLVL